jgi:hypothetical protein
MKHRGSSADALYLAREAQLLAAATTGQAMAEGGGPALLYRRRQPIELILDGLDRSTAIASSPIPLEPVFVSYCRRVTAGPSGPVTPAGKPIPPSR